LISLKWTLINEEYITFVREALLIVIFDWVDLSKSDAEKKV
jgi:hypothetical protein